MVRGFAGDPLPVVPELRRRVVREHEVHAEVAAREVLQRHDIHRLIDLAVEVVHPELVEIGEHHVARPVRDRPDPIVERLAQMELKLFPALLHFEQQPSRPDKVGEASPLATILFLQPVFQNRAGFLIALVPERDEEAVTEDLRLALLVALQPLGIRDELFKPVGGL